MARALPHCLLGATCSGRYWRGQLPLPGKPGELRQFPSPAPNAVGPWAVVRTKSVISSFVDRDCRYRLLRIPSFSCNRVKTPISSITSINRVRKTHKLCQWKPRLRQVSGEPVVLRPGHAKLYPLHSARAAQARRRSSRFGPCGAPRPAATTRRVFAQVAGAAHVVWVSRRRRPRMAALLFAPC